MKKEDLSKLKKGDKVCITMNAEVNGLVDDGETLSVRTSQIDACLFVHCSNIERGGVRRKFRKGDIIRTLCGGAIYEVQSDEVCLVSVNYRGEQKQLDVSRIGLVCAVENREDRKEGEV